MKAKSERKKERRSPEPDPHEPVDVVDGIANRRAAPKVWMFAVLAAVFVGWVAFLIYSAVAGAQ